MEKKYILFFFIIKNILNNEYLSELDKEKLLYTVNITNDNYNKLNIKGKYSIDLNDYNSILLNNNITNDNNCDNSSCDFSIIIYIYEYKHLSKTLNTLLNQKSIKIEIIIIYDNDNNIEKNV